MHVRAQEKETAAAGAARLTMNASIAASDVKAQLIKLGFSEKFARAMADYIYEQAILRREPQDAFTGWKRVKVNGP